MRGKKGRKRGREGGREGRRKGKREGRRTLAIHHAASPANPSTGVDNVQARREGSTSSTPPRGSPKPALPPSFPPSLPVFPPSSSCWTRRCIRYKTSHAFSSSPSQTQASAARRRKGSGASPLILSNLAFTACLLPKPRKAKKEEVTTSIMLSTSSSSPPSLPFSPSPPVNRSVTSKTVFQARIRQSATKPRRERKPSG